MKHTNQSEKEKQEELKELVIARLERLPDELAIFVGSKSYTKDDLLESVRKEDEVGKEFVEMQIEYLQDMAAGALYREANG